MPFLDWLLFKNGKKNIATLNIGGISNLSLIPKKCSRNQVLGFDTGPGKCLIDQCVDRLNNIRITIPSHCRCVVQNDLGVEKHDISKFNDLINKYWVRKN